MTTQLVRLLIGSVVMWVCCAVPAWLLAGESALLDTAVALALCLVPMLATLVWFHSSLGALPEQQLLAVLGGTGIRMLVVLLGGIGLYYAVPTFHRPAFLLWVIVFYLATLTLEVVLVVRRQNALADESAQSLQPPRGS